MKNRTGKPAIAIRESKILDELVEIRDAVESKEIATNQLLQRIDSLVMRIAVLEKALEAVSVSEEKAWTFDVNRDVHGRIQNVIAHQTGDKRVLM